MTAKPRTLAQLISHPWVDYVSDERDIEDGIWVYLKPGFLWDGLHTIHEATVRECCAEFSYVEECPDDEWLNPPPSPSPAPSPAPSPSTVATEQRRPLHPLAEMLLMRLAATDQPCLAVERLPLWDHLAEAGWIELWSRVSDPGQAPWCECRITVAGRAALAARPVE